MRCKNCGAKLSMKEEIENQCCLEYWLFGYCYKEIDKTLAKIEKALQNFQGDEYGTLRRFYPSAN